MADGFSTNPRRWMSITGTSYVERIRSINISRAKQIAVNCLPSLALQKASVTFVDPAWGDYLSDAPNNHAQAQLEKQRSVNRNKGWTTSNVFPSYSYKLNYELSRSIFGLLGIFYDVQKRTKVFFKAGDQ